MQQRLKEILERALKEIRECREVAQLEKSRVKYLGKKGELTVFLRGMGDLSPEERPAMGRLVNEAKEEVECCWRHKGKGAAAGKGKKAAGGRG